MTQIVTAVKKPIEIEAVHYDGSVNCGQFIERWSQGKAKVPTLGSRSDLQILTLEGLLFAAPDCYIIKGIKGEFYPCDPEIFHATYEIMRTREHSDD